MKIFIIWFNLWSLGFSIYAQDSLIHYLELAAKNNPVVIQKYNEYQAALQKVPQVGSLPDPEISMGVFLSPMELVSGRQVADMRLMQMFPWFGVLKNAKDEMSLMAKARYESFRDAKATVFYDLQRTWYELLKIREEIRISEENLNIMHSLERISINKYKAGANAVPDNSPLPPETERPANAASMTNASSGNMNNNGPNTNPSTDKQPISSMQNNPMGSSQGTGLSDIYQLEIEIAELENNLIFLRDQNTILINRINVFIGRNVNSPISVNDSLLKDSAIFTVTTNTDSILQNNPMLGMLQYEQQSLVSRKNMVKRMAYPMVGIGVNYSLIQRNEMSASSMNGKDMVMPMIVVTLPIYRKKYNAIQMETDFLKDASEKGYEAATKSLQLEYAEAKKQFLDADRRITLYEKQSLLVDKTLAIATRTFSVSGIGLSDLLQLHQKKLNYSMKRAESVADYNSSLAWLRRLMASSGTNNNDNNLKLDSQHP